MEADDKRTRSNFPGFSSRFRFTADLELWCKYSKIYGYANNTTSTCKGKNLEEIIKNLKADAESILSYMASNGLVANAKKLFIYLLV